MLQILANESGGLEELQGIAHTFQGTKHRNMAPVTKTHTPSNLRQKYQREAMHFLYVSSGNMTNISSTANLWVHMLNS